MRFKQFINENDMPEVEEYDLEADLSQVNFRLADELDKTFLSPESGIMAVRKVLEKFDLELPALYGANPEGEELIVDLDATRLYILYSPTDDSRYEFYAEIGDDERMEELMSDEGETEEEE
jgi:hypothetical protein